jgi:hypothetical protein
MVVILVVIFAIITRIVVVIFAIITKIIFGVKSPMNISCTCARQASVPFPRDLVQGKRDLVQGKRDLEQGKRDLVQGIRDLVQRQKRPGTTKAILRDLLQIQKRPSINAKET